MDDIELTPQQSRAVSERNASVVLSSGAGCGKTTVLTARYVSHLVSDGAGVSELVAMTFTDKAARSMRQRIRLAIEKQIQSKAGDDREVWRRHLRDLETANISTIHAFCGNLLRRHSLAARLDPGFEILDAAIAGNLLSKSLSETMNSLVIEPGDVGDALRELVRTFGWSQTRRGLEGLMQGADEARWREWAKSSPKKIAADWFKYHQSEFVPRRIAEQTGPGSTLHDVLTFFRITACTGPKMQARIGDIIALAQELATGKKPEGVAADLRAVAQVQGTERDKAWPDKASYETIKNALTELRAELGTFTEDCAPPSNLESAAAMGRHFLTAALACQHSFDREKHQIAGIDFQDMIVRARNLLAKHKDILSAVRRSVRFLLVDELQDTDPVQMELVELICGAELKTGKLFAVGDAKQSIYRFRGAEVALFESLYSAVPERGRQSLTSNYRSQTGILKFVNALFAKAMPGYEPLDAGLPSVGEHLCVEFLWSDTGDNAEANRRLEARRIACRISEMIAGREQLAVERPKDKAAHLRGIQAGDIVLLFRAMTNVRIYEEALRDYGIDYYLVGGKAFFAQQELYDVLNLLRVLENPHDLLSLAGVLRSPFGGLSDETLFSLGARKGGLWAALHDASARESLPDGERPVAERVCRWLDDWRGIKDRVSIPMLLQRILADSGYDAALQYERLGDRKLANLWKLQEIARTFDRPGGFGLPDFIHELNRLTEAVPHEAEAATLPEESNVVRIMSIHQAKGLEFPVVFMPDMASQRGGGAYPVAQWDDALGCFARPPDEGDDTPLFSRFPVQLWQSREDAAERAEELRTMYVGCTRAADYLVLSASIDAPPKLKNDMIELLAERFDLQTGDGVDGESPPARVAPALTGAPAPAGKIGATTGLPLSEADGRDVEAIAPDPHSGIELVEYDVGAATERTIRAVLAQWDLQDGDGWREPLSALNGATFGWARFARSTVRKSAAASREVFRAVEYVAESRAGPIERGIIDLLWRDASGWHVVGIAASGEADDDGWLGRKDALIKQALAVRLPVIDVQLYVWATGDVLHASIE